MFGIRSMFQPRCKRFTHSFIHSQHFLNKIFSFLWCICHVTHTDLWTDLVTHYFFCFPWYPFINLKNNFNNPILFDSRFKATSTIIASFFYVFSFLLLIVQLVEDDGRCLVISIFLHLAHDMHSQLPPPSLCLPASFISLPPHAFLSPLPPATCILLHLPFMSNCLFISGAELIFNVCAMC